MIHPNKSSTLTLYRRLQDAIAFAEVDFPPLLPILLENKENLERVYRAAGSVLGDTQEGTYMWLEARYAEYQRQRKLERQRWLGVVQAELELLDVAT